MQITDRNNLSTILKTALVCTVLLVFCSNLYAQQTMDLKIESLEPSTRTDKRIKVSAAGDKAFLPVTIINGVSKGPIFTVIAGIHGYEYPPIMAAQLLIKSIKPEQLNGTVVIVPIANPEGFYNRTVFNNPVDGKNLNRVFPGKKDGSISEKIAHWITTQIIPVSDIFLDIHAGDANEDLIPFSCYYDNQLNIDKTSKALELCLSAGFPYTVTYPYTLKKSDKAEYAFKHAAQDGKVALSIEAGKLGQSDDKNTSLICDGVFRMLTKMGMYKGELNSTVSATPQVFKKQFYIKSPARGIFYSTFKSGDEVKKGMLLGRITDEFGNVLSDVISLNDGMILYKVGTPPVNKGETLFCIVAAST